MTGPLHGSQDSAPPAAPFSPSPEPPPAFSAPEPVPSRRPTPVVLATLGLGVAALLKLLQSAVTLVNAAWIGGGHLTLVLRYSALDLLLGLFLAVAAVMVISGRDGSRIMAAAVAGAAVWSGAGWLSNAVVTLVQQQASPLDWNWSYLISLLLVGLAMLLALLALVLLAGRAAGDWFHQKRTAGAPTSPAPSYGVPGNV